MTVNGQVSRPPLGSSYWPLTDLQTALAGRAVIDQALGIIMGQRRCSADEAFGVLREVSQTSNLKLREVAVRLITVTSGGPPRPEPPLQPAAPAG